MFAIQQQRHVRHLHQHVGLQIVVDVVMPMDSALPVQQLSNVERVELLVARVPRDIHAMWAFVSLLLAHILRVRMVQVLEIH